MGIYVIDCRICNEPFSWFSGSMDQRCDSCKGDITYKVVLKRLPIVDLGIKYVRGYEGTNKLTHYRVAHSHAASGVNSITAIRNYILEREPYAIVEFQEPPSSLDSGVEDQTYILDNEPEIKAALQQVKVDSLLYQYNKLYFQPNKFQLILGYATRTINDLLIAPINSLIYKFRIKDFQFTYQPDFMAFEDSVETKEIDDFEKHLAKKSAFRRFVANIKQIPLLPRYEGTEYTRAVTPCLFHSVTYEEGDEAKAAEVLLQDLRIVHGYKAILGHLAMPTRIALSNATGSGKKIYALFCFFFAEFYTIPGWNPLTAPRAPSPFPGVRTAAYEGGIGSVSELDYTNRYDIEHIEVLNTYEENRNASIDAYKESVPTVNAVAKAMDARIKKMKEGT